MLPFWHEKNVEPILVVIQVFFQDNEKSAMAFKNAGKWSDWDTPTELHMKNIQCTQYLINW